MLEIFLAVIKRKQIFLNNQMLQLKLKVASSLTIHQGRTKLSKTQSMTFKDAQMKRVQILQMTLLNLPRSKMKETYLLHQNKQFLQEKMVRMLQGQALFLLTKAMSLFPLKHFSLLQKKQELMLLWNWQRFMIKNLALIIMRKH